MVSLETVVIMSNKFLVVGYYDELTHVNEVGPYNPDWDIDSVANWIEVNPEVTSLDDPDYKNKNQIRQFELSEQWELEHLKLKAKSQWSMGRKRLFAIITTQTPDQQNELNYITDHSNNIYVSNNGKQEYVTSVETFAINDWSAFYISIYENDDFSVKVKKRQVNFASSIGIELNNYVNAGSVDRPQSKLFDITLRKSALYDDDDDDIRTPVYYGDNYDPIYFRVNAYEYVKNTNFGSSVSIYGNNGSDASVKVLDKVAYPRNSNTYYKYEITNYLFDIPEHNSHPLADSLLESSGVSLRDTNYHMGSRPLDSKLLLSSRFNLVNLMILDSFQYMGNERYYLTPNMKRFLQSHIPFENEEIQKDMDVYYRDIVGIIGAKGSVRNEIESILRQHDEVSFRVLKHIMLISRVHGSFISVMDRDIDDTLKTHESEVTNALRSNNVNADDTHPHRRYVLYDKLLITKARNYMESFFHDLTLVTI